MIETSSLTYVFPDVSVGIHPTTIRAPTGSRTLLIGANGAGKSTLLKLLAGKTLAKSGSVSINNQDPFRDGVAGITYLGTEWASNPIVRHDMPVPLLIESIGGSLFQERRDLLVDLLDVDLTWRMHAVSDGERRRVQLVMGLLRPWHTLLLDEVTVDLDVLVRKRLLNFLKSETETRECSIIYATHIFDGLDTWPTHLGHMHLGKIVEFGEMTHYTENDAETNSSGRLLHIAITWLEKDLEIRGERMRKPKWNDIAPSVIQNGPIEEIGNDGFMRYFKASRN